jgi:cyanophycin synthetase
VDVVLSEGVAVLNADDALVAAMAEYCDGKVIYFSRQIKSELVAAHVLQGGQAVVVRDACIVLAGGEQTSLIELAQVPLLKVSKDAAQMDSVLAAVAAAWVMGVSPELMRAGLSTFESEPANTKEIA